MIFQGRNWGPITINFCLYNYHLSWRDTGGGGGSSEKKKNLVVVVVGVQKIGFKLVCSSEAMENKAREGPAPSSGVSNIINDAAIFVYKCMLSMRPTTFI